jgi:phage/plasmid-associated DNA primase
VYAGQVQKISEGRFTFGDLFGKLLFTDDDVPAGIKLPDGQLKLISEEKLLTGEQKFKPSFNFVCRAVPLLLCNNVPSLADLSHGMLRRLIVVPFDRRFDEHEHKIDRKLFPTIWREEMPGVLNRALEGYARLVRDGRFILPAPVRAARTSWLRHANPLAAFLNELGKVDTNGRTLVAVLYVAFCDWAKAAGITRVQQRLTFRRNLEYIGFRIIRTNRGEAVVGLVLRTEPNPDRRRPAPAVIS